MPVPGSTLAPGASGAQLILKEPMRRSVRVGFKATDGTRTKNLSLLGSTFPDWLQLLFAPRARIGGCVGFVSPGSNTSGSVTGAEAARHPDFRAAAARDLEPECRVGQRRHVARRNAWLGRGRLGNLLRIVELFQNESPFVARRSRQCHRVRDDDCRKRTARMPLAIPLWFKKPPLVRKAFVCECRQYRHDPFRL
jgi:hypothetical protein